MSFVRWKRFFDRNISYGIRNIELLFFESLMNNLKEKSLIYFSYVTSLIFKMHSSFHWNAFFLSMKCFSLQEILFCYTFYARKFSFYLRFSRWYITVIYQKCILERSEKRKILRYILWIPRTFDIDSICLKKKAHCKEYRCIFIFFYPAVISLQILHIEYFFCKFKYVIDFKVQLKKT